MHRLFLDANILLSAAYRANAGLVQFWKLKDTTLCSSRYALEEARINLADSVQRHRLAKLARQVQLLDAIPRDLPAELSLPDKDVPIFRSAIEARATHLITGDIRHFGPYFGRQIEGILILAPADYLKKHLR
jgi:predicted nucleic acid-binding protein